MDTGSLYPGDMDIDHFIAALMAAPSQAPLGEDVILEDHGQSMVYRGRPAVTAVLEAYFKGGFSDGRMNVQEIFTNGPSQVVTFVFHGRQDGAFLGIPATGREVSVPMILLIRVTEEKIRYLAWYYDAGTLLRQLGLSLSQNAGSISEARTQ